jgi:two-component system, NtrC family, sensor kinase
MTLRRKTLLVVGGTLLGLVVPLHFVMRTVGMRSYGKLEERSVRRDVERAVDTLMNTIAELDTKATDWATWDDAYAFVREPSPAFIESNLAFQALAGLRLNLLVFLDSTGQVVFGKATDLQAATELPLPGVFQQGLPADHPLLQHAQPTSGLKGLLRLPDGLLMLSVRPILPTSGDGPARGTLLMGRYLNAAEVARLSALVHLPVEICRCDGLADGSDWSAASARLAAASSGLVQPVDDDVIRGYALVPDIFGKPELILRVTVPREIYHQGQAGMHHLLEACLLVGLVSGILTLVLLERLVLARLARLSAGVGRVRENHDLSQRVPDAGTDELSNLGSAINDMLGTLGESHRVLRASEERFRSWFDLPLVGIAVIAPDTRWIEVNDKLCDMLGYRRAELAQRTWAELCHPEDRPALLARMASVLDGTLDGYSADSRFVRQDGSIIQVAKSARCVRLPDGSVDYLVAVVQDITDRKLKEHEVLDGETRLKIIIDAVQAGVILIDRATHVIADANPAALALFGAPREAVIGAECHRFICPAERGRCPVTDLRQTVESSERVLLAADGRKIPILKTVVLIKLRGREYLLESFVDITAQKHAEQELALQQERLEKLVRQRSDELVQAQHQILQAEKLASVGQLAAGVAHEINTPIQYVGDNLRALSDFLGDLTALVAQYHELADLVEQNRATPEAVQALRSAEEQIDLPYIVEDAPKAIAQGLEGVVRVTHIVRAMKDFSHVDRGTMSAADLNAGLQSTLTVARNEYKYVAELETDFGELPPVDCYQGELNQVFLNLVVNAAHAIADTGQRGRITVRTRADGDHVEIAIGDTGTGIPEAIRTRIFDPFFTTKEVGKGTGQGLYIAHQIVVQKHGGTLRFETAAGQGTTFFLRIPVRAAAETAA